MPTVRLKDVVAILAVALVILLVLEGPSIRRSGERMEPGPERTIVLAIGHPAGWIADRLPFADAGDDIVAAIAPGGGEGDGGGPSSFASGQGRAGGGVPPVTPESFAPQALGERPPARRALRKVLITGDSMVMPLDAELARRAVRAGAQAVRDPHLGTGISKSELADWGELSAEQVRDEQPDAVVMWLGANEGFPMTTPSGDEVTCCDAAWAAEYATRARRMMDTYRQDGRARVYWLKLPVPRDTGQARVARAVNAAVAVAAEAYRAHVRVLDMAELFTPGGRYRDAMEVGGRERIVRESDGIHVNATGARVAADAVERALRTDFALR
jgi:lysophospholipase L1-like esterase